MLGALVGRAAVDDVQPDANDEADDHHEGGKELEKKHGSCLRACQYSVRGSTSSGRAGCRSVKSGVIVREGG